MACGLMPAFVNKVLLAHRPTIYVYGCFHAVLVQLSCRNRDRMTCKPEVFTVWPCKKKKCSHLS